MKKNVSLNTYRVFINYVALSNIVIFPKSFVIFLNCSAALLVFYLPVVCTHTDTKSPEYSKIFGKKNTIFNEHSVV